MGRLVTSSASCLLAYPELNEEVIWDAQGYRTMICYCVKGILHRFISILLINSTMAFKAGFPISIFLVGGALPPPPIWGEHLV